MTNETAVNAGVPAQGELCGTAALVCGATGHIGAAIVKMLADMGASVGVQCRTQTVQAHNIVRALPEGKRHTVVTGDLSDGEGAQRLLDQAANDMGRPVTVVVDAAYPTQPPSLVSDLTDEYIERHLDGFRTHLNVCRASVPGMQHAGWGRIVLISGALAWRPFPGFSVFSAVKAGVTAFSRTLALEVGQSGITVNTVALGRIEYDGGGMAGTVHPSHEALDDVVRRRVALPRMASPQDVAETVRFLTSPRADAVTGQIVFLAGGEPV